MSQTPITISYSLEEILKQINGKLDKMDEKFDTLEKNVNKINERLIRVETKLDTLETDVKELKGSTKAQIWTLIGILVTAVGGFIVAVGKLAFFPNP